MSGKVDPMQTRNYLSENKAFMKFGNLPINLMLGRFFMILYLQVVSYASFRSKNTATTLLLDFWLSYRSFNPDHMIHCRSLAPEAALGVGKKVVGFNEPN